MQGHCLDNSTEYIAGSLELPYERTGLAAGVQNEPLGPIAESVRRVPQS